MQAAAAKESKPGSQSQRRWKIEWDYPSSVHDTGDDWEVARIDRGDLKRGLEKSARPAGVAIDGPCPQNLLSETDLKAVTYYDDLHEGQLVVEQGRSGKRLSTTDRADPRGQDVPLFRPTWVTDCRMVDGHPHPIESPQVCAGEGTRWQSISIGMSHVIASSASGQLVEYVVV